jgi:signal transduction histidine kinase
LGVMVNGYQRMVVDLKNSLAHTRDAEESARRSERHLRQVLDDRARMAQDLHDGIIQSLFAQTLNLERCRRLVRTQAEEVIEQVGHAVEGLKTVIRDLRGYLGGWHPEPAEGHNLKQALASHVRLMQDVSGMKVDVKMEPAATQLVMPEQAMHILYIAR